MRHLPGQAARACAMLAHWLATLGITIGVLGGVGIGAIAWRLSQGPMDLDWFTGRLEAAANTKGSSTRLTIGSAALAWEGFRLGVDRPLDLRLTDVQVTDQSGERLISLPRAEVSLSIYELLFLRLVPRAVTLDSLQLSVLRAADGTLSLDLGSAPEAADTGDASAPAHATPLADLLGELARPPGNDRTLGRDKLLEQLRVVRVHDANLRIVDRQLGVTWRAPHAEIDLVRRPQGGVVGTADLSLAVGEQQARLTMAANLRPGGKDTQVRVRLSPVRPDAIARAAPSLAALSAFDAPVGGEATLDLDEGLAVRQASISLQAGTGQVHIGAGEVPLLSAGMVASITPDAVALETLQVNLRGHEGGPPTRIEAHGTVQRSAGQINASVSADIDQVEFADLPQLWPRGTAEGARQWLVSNIPAGTAHNGHIDLGLSALPDLAGVELTRATGTLDGDGLEVHWLRPVPPIDGGQAQLRIVDPDTLDIVVTGGRQRLRQRESGGRGLQIRSGRMRITGLMRPRQVGVIEADVSGTVPDTIALLREPRLQLLDRHPIELNNPAGQVAAKLSLSVPLEDNATMDDVPVQVQAHLDGVHLGRLIAGRDLDQGVLDLTASNDGMKVSGRALLAAIPAKLDATMDFRAGPPSQVVQSATISGQADARQLAAAGLDATPLLSGVTQLQAVLTERRNGQGDVAVNANLTGAELVVDALDWRKPRDASAKASARLLLNQDRLSSIDAVQVDADGLVLRGRADASGGTVTSLRVDRLVLGRTVAQGMLTLPASGPITGSITGPVLDLAPRLSRKTPPQSSPRATKAEPPPGPPWTVDAKFDRLLMAGGVTAGNVALHAEDDGRVLRQLNVDGRAGRGRFQARIIPDPGGRRVAATADDAGELLRGLDYLRSMQAGKLSVQAQYDDTQPDRPLAGTATIEDFRIRDAPAFGKLLQAMTLYGLVQAMQGPGLGFTRLVAPFRLTEDALELTDARAFSPSLGLTAKGRADLAAQQLDMQGTIVPAYFFNSLLGNIPLVGKLFSPERGGGVFAASYTVRGRIENPEVSVNPLTALTPGFLRGVFGIF